MNYDNKRDIVNRYNRMEICCSRLSVLKTTVKKFTHKCTLVLLGTLLAPFTLGMLMCALVSCLFAYLCSIILYDVI